MNPELNKTLGEKINQIRNSNVISSADENIDKFDKANRYKSVDELCEAFKNI